MNLLNFRSMKRSQSTFRFPALCAVLAAVLSAGIARGQIAEQTVSLVSGWNAVWLEVEPIYPAGHPKAGQPKAPGDVFPAEVLTVISPKPLAGTAEFFAADPTNVGSFNQEDWEQWHNPAGVDDNLALVTGNRAYLIEVSGNKNFVLAGKVRFHRPVWAPDRYNLVGFGLDGTPSFVSFFRASDSRHTPGKIYRLKPDGNWVTATTAPVQAMKSDEAYWIFSSGPSTYMGPVAVDFDLATTGLLNFGGPEDAVVVDSGVDAKDLDLKSLVFTNLEALPAIPPAIPSMLQVTNLDPAAGAPGDLELLAVRPTTDPLGWESVAMIGGGAGLQETIALQSSATLTIGAKRNWTTGLAGRTNIYRLTTGAGSAFWFTASALNSSLQLPTDTMVGDAGAVAGLWVGEVSVNAASSIVVDGAPVLPAATPAPIRLLLHSNNLGAVSLLSQVTIMQTRSADPEILPVPVLVVDQAKIPFFEGIKERNGKQVGVRLEAVSYDMPRRTDAASQSVNPLNPANPDLIDMIVAESTSPVTEWLSGAGLYTDRLLVDEAAIDSYLLFRTIRPPALKEVYQLSLPVSGAIGAGKTVQTNADTLILDPFHRSNPYRHAFDQRHPKGPKITREMTIVFDPTQSTPGLLRGTYHEILKGVIASDIELSGAIRLRLVSDVDTLDAAP